MAWNPESAANDLESYVLRGEKPAVDAVRLAVDVLRGKAKPCDTCANGGPFNWCEDCMFGHANCYEPRRRAR